jgi:uncharacterized protein (DUF433 family)
MIKATTDLIEIRSDPIVGDRAYVVGTRVSVEDVYMRHELGGQTPDDIVQSLSHLSLAQVHAALSYAYAHLDELRRQMKDGDAFVARIKSATGPGPLARKLSTLDGSRDEISS